MNQYVIMKNGSILYRLNDNDTDLCVEAVETAYENAKSQFNHSFENPVTLEYWIDGEASKSRIISPFYMKD